MAVVLPGATANSRISPIRAASDAVSLAARVTLSVAASTSIETERYVVVFMTQILFFRNHSLNLTLSIAALLEPVDSPTG
jgi:hypothetical protein